jgi:hypothetical protein
MQVIRYHKRLINLSRQHLEAQAARVCHQAQVHVAAWCMVRIDSYSRDPSGLRSSQFDNIFENSFASCSFGLAKDISDCFRKGSFLYFVAFLSFFGASDR